jgi:hypothetical protein
MAADAVQWRVEDGGNGHWYQRETNGMTWHAARAFSQARGGDLVSLEAAGEWQWVSANVPGSFYLVGGYQRADATSVFEGWTWLTGSPISGLQTNFDDNPCGLGSAVEDRQQDYIEMVGAVIGDINSGLVGSCTDDGARPFLIEWSADCNNDGIVDFGQCRDGSLPDYNGNNTPDCCEQGTSCVVGSYPVQWRSADGGNGHWYACRSTVGIGDIWALAQSNAVADGAHLATLTSAAENQWVYSLSVAKNAWVGRRGPLLGGFKAPDNTFRWVTGEPWTFASWLPGEPSSGLWEPYLHYMGPQFTEQSSATWNDTDGLLPPDVRSLNAVFEWSADCNADGIVDHGQILGGELADTNANGVPDTCESTLLVPSQFPTIQAAIDSVPAGAQRTVQVAAGTYNESFSLNGKNVVIRGAANNATILDGTGLTTSIARFTGGEPASAGVEQLVFRNGTAGSRFTSKSNFTVGGAIYATDTAARIARCRCENCSADFGGAVYQKTGVLAWDDCVFVGNAARSEGGAVLVYNCTGIVRGCSFTTNRCGLLGPGSGSAFKSVGSNGEGESVVLDSCTITANVAGDSGSAVEHYEHTEFHPGVLRIVNTVITGNTSGQPTPVGAGGLRVLGRMQSCVIGAGSQICDNLARDIDGPYFIEGSPTICDCSADITRDDVVNGGDLGVLLSNWGVAGTNGLGDVTHDGMVDGGDLAVVLSSWGTCP